MVSWCWWCQNPPNQSSQPDDWFTGLPPVHVITAGSALIVQEQKIQLLWHFTSVNATCLWNKQTNMVGHDLFKHPLWGKQTRLRFVAFLRMTNIYFHCVSPGGYSYSTLTRCRFYAPLWQAPPTALTTRKKQNWTTFWMWACCFCTSGRHWNPS